ncbi:hypothetical protein [Novosphingobium sp.]|uniref:hypothetical protein n=1 Tax=Novosphingobium sp. TaxID=1874826 RepID=UPI001EBF4DD2|nr:hypothetical protein [Novosphingobium sp.]MBK9009428.1 hypothetical protein [Novosphingobium sp.]
MKEAPLKSLKSARKKISNEDFIAWVNARSTGEDKRGNWMRAIVLFEDYAGWIESAARNRPMATMLSPRRPC